LKKSEAIGQKHGGRVLECLSLLSVYVT